MKLNIFIVLMTANFLISCQKTQATGDTTTNSTPITNSNLLDQNSPMKDFVGKWTGIGTVAITGSKNTNLNCEKVEVTISAASSTRFSLRDDFTCNKGKYNFSTGAIDFVVTNSQVFIQNQEVGYISFGSLTIHLVENNKDVEWFILPGQQLHYTYTEQTNGITSSATATLLK